MAHRYSDSTVPCNCESIVCTHPGSADGESCQSRAPKDGNKITYIGSVCNQCYKSYGAKYQLPKDRGPCGYPGHFAEDREDRDDFYLYPVPGTTYKACESCKNEIAFEKYILESERRAREDALKVKYKCDQCPAAFATQNDLNYHVSLNHRSILGTRRYR